MKLSSLACLLVLAVILCPVCEPTFAERQSALPAGITASDFLQLKKLFLASLPNGQEAYLKASNTDTFDFFGHSVAAYGDTVVISARNEGSNATSINGDQSNNSAGGAGAVYVFVRNGTAWTQQAYLKATNTEASDSFGESIAIYGDSIVVGAPGEDSSATGINGNASNNSKAFSGAAYIFVRNGTAWSQQAYLKASNTDTGDSFGNSVAIYGETVVVGAYNESSAATGVNGNQSDNSASNAGAAYVFVRSGTTWTQEAYLKASNTASGDTFGQSVSLYGDTLAVGALGEDSAATGVDGNQADNSAADSGAVYVFTRSGSTWTQQAYLKASNTDANDKFGVRTAAYGDTIAVGAWGEDSGTRIIDGNQTDNSTVNAGAVYVFVRSGVTWTQQAYLKASNADANDNFGISLALEADTLLVGAWGESSSATGVNGDSSINSRSNAGAVYGFTRNGTTWSQSSYLKASTADSDDFFGTSVAIAGDTAVVGAFGEDSNATGIDGDQSNNSLDRAGAAYVLVYTPTEQTTNGDFETYAGKARVPSSWRASKSFGSADGKSRTKKTGSFGVVINGSSTLKTLSQTIQTSGNTNDSLTISFWSKGKNVPKTGKWQAAVNLYNGTTLVKSQTVKCPKGTYSWRSTSRSFVAPASYTKIVVKFSLRASGKIYLDAVSLLK